LAASVLAAAALGLTRRPGLAVAILLLNLSTVDSVQALLADKLHVRSIEATAPAMLVSLALILSAHSRRHALVGTISGALSAVAVWGSNYVLTAPEAVLAVGAVPVTLAAVLVGAAGHQPSRSAVPVGFVFAVALATWFWVPPKSSGENWLLLPDARDTHEEQLY